LEATGAQVVAVRYDLDKDALREIFKNINGLLFTGGATPLLLS
jgi:hypothetical protein